MEELIYDPENWKYGAAVAAAASGYVLHRLKKDKAKAFTSAEIDMYLEGETGFDAGPVDKIYLGYEKWKREENEEDPDEGLLFAD